MGKSCYDLDPLLSLCSTDILLPYDPTIFLEIYSRGRVPPEFRTEINFVNRLRITSEVILLTVSLTRMEFIIFLDFVVQRLRT